PCLRPSRRFRTDFWHELSSRHPKVGQREQRQQMRGVLLQATKAHLHQAELALDHAKRVLYLCAHAGLAMFALLKPRLRTTLRQLRDVARPGGDMPPQIVALHTRLRTAV